jgi:K+-transporting ATPase ATPase C chain
MLKTIYKSVVVMGALLVVLCGVYPLVVFAVGQIFFRSSANGSLIYRGDQVIGSSLIGQGFSRPEYFHPRPSAAGEKGYDAANSSGSNLGPTSQKLAKGLESNVQQVLKENPALRRGEVPVDLVTASASGLDPHISPASAEIQVPRVAVTRKISAEQVRQLVAKNTQGRQLGFLGEPVVNVLQLNLDLDQLPH